MDFKRFFLYRLYIINKRLFFLITSFLILTLVANISGNEVTPFFVFGMYSEIERPSNRYQVVDIILNDSIHLGEKSYWVYGKSFVQMPLLYYKLMYEKGADPTVFFLQEKLGKHYKFFQPFQHRLFNGKYETNAFKLWFASYLGECIKTHVNSIEIQIHSLHYKSGGRLVHDSSNVLEIWKVH